MQEVHGKETDEHTSNNPGRVLSDLNFDLRYTKYKNYQQAVTLMSMLCSLNKTKPPAVLILN